MTTKTLAKYNPATLLAIIPTLMSDLDSARAVEEVLAVEAKADALVGLAKRLGVELAVINAAVDIWLQSLWELGAKLPETHGKMGRTKNVGNYDIPDAASHRWRDRKFFARQLKAALKTRNQITNYLKAQTEANATGTLAGCLHFAKGGLYTSDSGLWCTPKDVIAAVVETLGAIDLDPCADDAKAVPASRHFTEVVDGLARKWTGRVYMNPPYGAEISAWVDKLADEYREGNVTSAVALVPARTDTSWMDRLAEYPRVFIRGRLHFSSSEVGAPFPSAVVYLGRAVVRFSEAFKSFGKCYVRFAP